MLSTWMFVAVLQGGIGYVQYFTGVPEMLVGAHIAGATALWVVTVMLVGSIVSTLPAATSMEPAIREQRSFVELPRAFPGPPKVRRQCHSREVGDGPCS